MTTLQRPIDAPSCDATPALRARIYAAALAMNLAARPDGVRGPRPLTQTTLATLRYLLWEAPRGSGALYPSAATIAKAISAGHRSVQRAIAVLSEFGLIGVHARWRRHEKAVFSGGKCIGTVRVGTRTSNAYSFGEPGMRLRQNGAEAIRDYKSLRLERDITSGRWLPAPVKSWFEAEMMTARQPGHGLASPALVAARSRLMAR